MARSATATDDLNEVTMARTPTPPAQTSILSRFKIADLKRSGNVNIIDPAVRARVKLKAAAEEQIQHAKAEMRGEQFNATRMKYVTDEDGNRVKVESAKRKMIWYWKQGGTYYTEVRYGSSPMDFGGGSAITCGPKLDNVVETLELVLQASENGELDDELARLAERRGRRGNKEPETPMEKLQSRTSRR